MAGRWLGDPEPIVCDVFWAFSAGRFRRDTLYSPEAIQKRERREGGFVVRDAASEYALWNSTIEIQCQPGQMFNVARRGTLGVSGWDPFNVGMSDSLYNRAQVIRERFRGTVSYEGEKELDGKLLPILLFKQEFGNEFAGQEYGPRETQLDRYWLDPARGFNPLRIETYFETLEKPAQVLAVLETKDLGGGRWLPMLVRYANVMENPVRGYEARVLEVDVQNAPTDDTFSIGVDAGGYNRITNQIIATSTGRVSLSDFRDDGSLASGQGNLEIRRRVLQRDAEAIHGEEPSQPEWPYEQQQGIPTSTWWWLGAGVLCLGLAVTLLLRRRV